MRVLKEKYGVDFMFAKGFNPTEHDIEVWHILRYLNHNIHIAITTDYIPFDVFDGVAAMSDKETLRIQELMIKRIKEL